ncbi:MAG TPA: hypothetical protein VHM25_04445, partial [Polyangiaceae bacterium]|nr:hypothetical protein [Polyangiaceae bacterium]
LSCFAWIEYGAVRERFQDGRQRPDARQAGDARRAEDRRPKPANSGSSKTMLPATPRPALA